MATVTATARPDRTSVRDNPAYQAYLILRTGFIVAPILFGLDKFTNLLTDWTTYLAPAVDRLVPGGATSAMLAVGVVEIVAGLVVAVRPRSAATWSPPGWPGSPPTCCCSATTTTWPCATSACCWPPWPWPGSPPPSSPPTTPPRSDDAAERAALPTSQRRSPARSTP